MARYIVVAMPKPHGAARYVGYEPGVLEVFACAAKRFKRRGNAQRAARKFREEYDDYRTRVKAVVR